MPHTFTRLLYHVVYSTKDRMPLLSGAWAERMHGYLGGIVRNLKGTPIQIGGVADHVHLFIQLPPTITIAEAVNKLKSNSSRWINEEADFRNKFAWQEGYAAFSVSDNRYDDTVRYIENQESHHAHRGFIDELKEFLERNGMEFTEADLH
ncbi:MAG: IS200/IS605 family transposase [Planctomycetes bacterium]|nr:IS200/IS605 family transposase [Planctomycetota bacterium]